MVNCAQPFYCLLEEFAKISLFRNQNKGTEIAPEGEPQIRTQI